MMKYDKFAFFTTAVILFNWYYIRFFKNYMLNPSWSNNFSI